MFSQILFCFLPKPEKVSFFGHNLWIKYRQFYKLIKGVVVSNHMKALCKLDYEFKMDQASKELVKKRRMAIERGIDPLDRRYPDIFDVLKQSKFN